MRFNSSWPGIKPSFVMAGLVPAIHVFGVARPQDVDARDKRGHDGREAVRFNSSWPGIKPSFVMAGLVASFNSQVGQARLAVPSTSLLSSWPDLFRPSTSLSLQGC